MLFVEEESNSSRIVLADAEKEGDFWVCAKSLAGERLAEGWFGFMVFVVEFFIKTFKVVYTNKLAVIEGLIVKIEYLSDRLFVGIRSGREWDKLWLVASDWKGFEKDFEPGFCISFIHFDYPGPGLNLGIFWVGDVAGVKLEFREFAFEAFGHVLIEVGSRICVRIDSKHPANGCDVGGAESVVA